MRKIILLALGAVIAWTGLALATPYGTGNSTMDWRTAGGGYKVLKGQCTFGYGVGGYLFQCPDLVSNDGTCHAYVIATLDPNTPPDQVAFTLEPYSGSAGRGCPAGGNPNDLLTILNPGAWYWVQGPGQCFPEIDFSASSPDGTKVVADPWKTICVSNP